MKNKLTKEEIELIKKLKSEGKTNRQIGEILKKSSTTIYYHTLSEEERLEFNKKRADYFRKLPLDLRRKKYKKQKEYNKNYRRNRYKNDPQFREKEREYQREYQRRKRK